MGSLLSTRETQCEKTKMKLTALRKSVTDLINKMDAERVQVAPDEDKLQVMLAQLEEKEERLKMLNKEVEDETTDEANFKAEMSTIEKFSDEIIRCKEMAKLCLLGSPKSDTEHTSQADAKSSENGNTNSSVNLDSRDQAISGDQVISGGQATSMGQLASGEQAVVAGVNAVINYGEGSITNNSDFQKQVSDSVNTKGQGISEGQATPLRQVISGGQATFGGQLAKGNQSVVAGKDAVVNYGKGDIKQNTTTGSKIKTVEVKVTGEGGVGYINKPNEVVVNKKN